MTSFQEIEAYTSKLVTEFTPLKVVLFGSYARGDAGEDSDVDLLVIMPHAGKAVHQALEIRRSIRKSFPLDLVVRAPEDVDERLACGDSFLSDALSTGRVLYEQK